MAEKVRLRDYQASILAKLESAKSEGAAAPAGYLGVVIGSRNVLIDLQEISETLPVAEIQAVPLVKDWFLGIANVRGVLYTINDLAQLLDNSFSRISSSTRLMIISESVATHVGFLADKMVGLRNLNTLQLRQDKAESICFKPETYEDAEKRVWHVLDCNQLVRSKEFATPYAT